MRDFVLYLPGLRNLCKRLCRLKAIRTACQTCAKCLAELEDQVQKNAALWGNVNATMKAAKANTLESLKTVLAGGLESKFAAVGSAHAARERCSPAQHAMHQLSNGTAGCTISLLVPCLHLTYSMVGIQVKLHTRVTHTYTYLYIHTCHMSM